MRNKQMLKTAQKQVLNIPDVRLSLPSTKEIREAREAYNKRAIAGHGSYPAAEYTEDKVDCEDCLKIVAYCKAIKKHDF